MDPRVKELSKLLTSYSCNLQKGEKVLIDYEGECCRPLVRQLIKDAYALGAKPYVIEAAKKARADAFIRTLPGGYNFVLQEGASNIAQGQRQLLTIARAMLNNPPILILDEATSSVDTRTEVMIQEAMSEMMKGKTSFVIAHRLSTIKDAENILYMQDGDILEVGNHETLMAKDGLYAKLYNSQFSDND